MKRISCILVCLALLLGMVPATMASDGVTTESAAFGSGGKLVCLTMAGRSVEVVTSGGNVSTDSPASGMVKGAVAAINGSFFNSYYSGGGTTFPGNYPSIFGAITQNGEIINAGGDNNCLGFTYDGKVLIDRVSFQTVAIVHGKTNFNVWGVNKFDSDPSGIALMTPKLTLPFTVPTDSKLFTVKDGKITAVAGGGTYTVPAGCKLLVFNKTAVADAQKWSTLPAVGDKVEFAYTYNPTQVADKAAWNNLKTAVTGGRMLVIGGKNVTATAAYNSQYDADAKQSNSGSAIRTFAAVLADGRLVLGTASGTFPQIAEGLIAKGATCAVSFDGGGSSMLYTKDGGFITPAGRELTTVLAVVDKPVPDVKPVMPVIPVIADPNGTSSWSAGLIEEAKSLNLIPSWMLYGYKKPITRMEFCTLLVQLIPSCGGQTAEQLRTAKGMVGAKFEAIRFTDTDNYNVRLCASLDIVNGYEGGQFKPDNTLTREQAATMLKRTADLLGTVQSTARAPFADEETVSAYARESVAFVTTCGIMNGMDGNRFVPRGSYSKEQAFVTMLNASKAIVPITPA